ncbi:phage tail tape measure protein [Streptosporangium sp. NPDC051023]|uniref:phage tail tape measure protein n=1 Tax=Streptosporangium sp. NPDC051023 TaxID=3155410 RepID=UPI00344B4115
MPSRDLRVNIDGDPSGINRAFKSAEESAKVFERELAKIEKRRHEAMTSIGGAAVGIGAGLLAGFGVAVKAAADFDKAMSGVAAASNASGKSLEALRAAALKAGADTAFSATEAAQAETELAKVGISTSDILGGALKGSLDLAAAGQLDLATAAKVSGQAMTIFGKSGKDVGHIADVLTAGATASSASVESMAESMEQAGLVAAQTGLSLEDTVGTLTAFSKAGLNGSDAGTSLKTMLQRLAAPTNVAAGLMQDLGINAFDASGQFVGIAAVAGQLRTALSQLTPQQRQAALATIFGSDAIRAATVLYADGEAGIRGYINAVNDQGAASRQAGKLMDNLAGDVEKLKGSLETALISGGSGATDVLRGLVQSVDGAVDAFNSLPGPVQAGLTAVGGIAGAATLAGGGLLLLIPKIAETKAAFVALGWTADTTKGKLLGVGKGVAIAAGAFIASEGAGAATDWLRGSSASADDLTRSLKRLAETGRFMGDLGDQWGGVFAEGEDAARRFGEATRETLNPSFWETYWEHPLSSITSILPGFTSTITGFTDKFKQMDAVLAQMVASGNAQQAQQAFAYLQQQAKDAGADVSQFATLFPQYGEALKTATGPANEVAGATGKITAAAEEATDALAELKAALQGTFDPSIAAFEAQTELERAFQSATAAIQKSHGALGLTGTAALEARDAFASLLHSVVNTATAQGTLRQDSDAARTAFLQQLPALYQLAGNSKSAQAQIRALASSFKISGGQAAAAKHMADSFGGSVAKLRDKSIKLKADPSQANAAVSGVQGRVNSLHGKTITVFVKTEYQSDLSRAALRSATGHAAGGMVRGPGTGTSDSVPILASNGEYVVNAKSTARHRELLEAINAGRFAQGGLVGYASGGAVGSASVPISEFVSRFMGTTATKEDVTKATNARRDAVEALRKAERKLAEDRRRHRSARTIADDEARVAKERRDLKAATDKLTKTEANYQKTRLTPSQQLQAGLALGIKNTGAFIKNVTRLADMGFGDLAQALLAAGGPEAEKMAADAVKLSKTKLAALNKQVVTAGRQQAQLDQLPAVLKIKDALRHGAKTVSAMVAYTGLSEEEIAAANQQAHLFASGGIMRYASGGWRPGPGVATRPTVLFGEGNGPEAYIPYDPAMRTRAAGLVRQVAADFGMGGCTIINVTVQGAIDPIGTARTVEKTLRTLVRTNGRVALNL